MTTVAGGSAADVVPVDLAVLPPPDVIAAIDYEARRSALMAGLIAEWPGYTALVETDPAAIIVQRAAYEGLLTRNDINHAARAVMVAYSTGADLDNLAALYGLTRGTIVAGNPNAYPPVAAVRESDDALRRRVLLAPEGYTVAGPRNQYIALALNASALVRDVYVHRPRPGDLDVYVLQVPTGDNPSGAPSVETLAAVLAAYDPIETTPLCDHSDEPARAGVRVLPATLRPYRIRATLDLGSTPDAELIRAAARVAVRGYVGEAQRFDGVVSVVRIAAALAVAGVRTAQIVEPAADLVAGVGEIWWCESLQVD